MLSTPKMLFKREVWQAYKYVCSLQKSNEHSLTVECADSIEILRHGSDNRRSDITISSDNQGSAVL